MESSYLDRYGRSKSVCHRLPPLVKLFLTLAVVLAGVSVPVRYWPVHGVLASIVFLGHSLARIPLAFVVRRLALFLPMLLMLTISLPLVQGFRSGWDLMAGISLRATVAFISMLWLVNVMPFDQLLVTLRRLWVPEVLVAMLAFMYRYLFVLWDEMSKMQRARRARTFGFGRRFFRWRSGTQLIGTLLIRALERAERVYGAMLARGWDGRVRTLDDQGLE